MQNHANFSLKLPICVILCGGKSSRMGQDKTLMEFGEFGDLTHFQFAKMSEIFDKVFVDADNPAFAKAKIKYQYPGIHRSTIINVLTDREY